MNYSKSIEFFVLLLLTGIQLLAYTVFICTDGKSNLAGSNEDLKKRNSQMWFIPTSEEKYGYDLFGYDGSVQAGLNEKGIFWDGLRAYPYTEVNNNKLDIGGNVLHKILEEFATVDDVESLLKIFTGYENQ
ncbi:MAG: hypothetical protein ACQERS_10530 [Bacteroidota bacterium]